MPPWTFVSTPSEIRFIYRERTPAVFRIHYKGPIRRLLGTDREGVLFIGAWAYLRRAFVDFIRCSTNGTKGDEAAQTLHYLRRISPGIAALFGKGSTGPHIELSYMLVPAKEAASTWYKTLEGYIRPFGELPPLNGKVPGPKGLAIKAPAAEKWTPFKHPSELASGRLAAIYRVHLEGIKIPRLTATDTEGILEIGKASFLRDRLGKFILAARNCRARHTEGQTLHHLLGISPKLRKMFARGIPACLGFSYRVVDPRYLFQEEDLSRDRYIREFGELPPLNMKVTEMRKKIMELMKELGIVKKRI
jgi:hypothetical protein